MLDHAVEASCAVSASTAVTTCPTSRATARTARRFTSTAACRNTSPAAADRCPTSRYLVLHESVEKVLIDELKLHYQHAHQIATQAEEAAGAGGQGIVEDI